MRPLLSDPDYIEQLKRDYVESTILLAESFARQAGAYLEQGDMPRATQARDRLEEFCASAWEMIRTLNDEKEAEASIARMRLVCNDVPQLKKSAAGSG